MDDTFAVIQLVDGFSSGLAPNADDGGTVGPILYQPLIDKRVVVCFVHDGGC